jgi:hypothetical protein
MIQHKVHPWVQRNPVTSAKPGLKGVLHKLENRCIIPNPGAAKRRVDIPVMKEAVETCEGAKSNVLSPCDFHPQLYKQNPPFKGFRNKGGIIPGSGIIPNLKSKI